MANGALKTIDEMRRKAIIADEEIAEAVESFLADPKLKAFRFASGHVLNIEAAVAAHAQARAAMAKKGTTDAYRRMMVRTAVILARPEAR